MSGLGVNCGSKVCTYPDVQNACASQIGYVNATQCALMPVVQVSCGSSCSGLTCGQCIQRSDQTTSPTCFDNCSNFENKNITITSCTTDYTGNACNCCMKVNPANKLGVCTSSTMFGSDKFTVYALARSIIF